LQGKKVALAAGHRDEFLTAEWLETEGRRLAPAAGEVRQFPFHGGHRLDRTVLAAVAGFFEAPAR
jgi:predicted esterase